jgi:hypothetical protein
VFHHGNPHIRLHPERRQMGTHQRRNVKQHGKQSASYCIPAVCFDMYRLAEIRPDFQHLFDDAPDLIKRDQSDHCTHCRKSQ